MGGNHFSTTKVAGVVRPVTQLRMPLQLASIGKLAADLFTNKLVAQKVTKLVLYRPYINSSSIISHFYLCEVISLIVEANVNCISNYFGSSYYR